MEIGFLVSVVSVDSRLLEIEEKPPKNVFFIRRETEEPMADYK
jgi:hypothetical protein